MTLTVTVKRAAFPNDQEFDIPGVGLVTNGKGTKITQEQEEAFIIRQGQTLKEGYADDPEVTVEGTSEIKGGAATVLAEEGDK